MTTTHTKPHTTKHPVTHTTTTHTTAPKETTMAQDTQGRPLTTAEAAAKLAAENQQKEANLRETKKSNADQAAANNDQIEANGRTKSENDAIKAQNAKADYDTRCEIAINKLLDQAKTRDEAKKLFDATVEFGKTGVCPVTPVPAITPASADATDNKQSLTPTKVSVGELSVSKSVYEVAEPATSNSVGSIQKINFATLDLPKIRLHDATDVLPATVNQMGSTRRVA